MLLPDAEHRLLPARPLRVSRAFYRELGTAAAGTVVICGWFLALAFGLFGWRAILHPFVAAWAAGTAFIAWLLWQRLALVHACARQSDEVWLRFVGEDDDTIEIDGVEVFFEASGAAIDRDGARWMLALRPPRWSPRPRIFERLVGPVFRWRLLPIDGRGGPFQLDAEQQHRLRERLRHA
jgi:hypothetical protein